MVEATDYYKLGAWSTAILFLTLGLTAAVPKTRLTADPWRRADEKYRQKQLGWYPDKEPKPLWLALLGAAALLGLCWLVVHTIMEGHSTGEDESPNTAWVTSKNYSVQPEQTKSAAGPTIQQQIEVALQEHPEMEAYREEFTELVLGGARFGTVEDAMTSCAELRWSRSPLGRRGVKRQTAKP